MFEEPYIDRSKSEKRIVSFARIASLTDDELRELAEGFPERQRLREIEEQRRAKSLEPSNEWYERRYDI